MSESSRSPRKSSRRQSGSDGALYALYDTLEDLYSILETLDELGISNRDELVAYISTLDAEIDELEAADRG